MQYSLDQTIFMLSMASNAVADIKATISGYQTELTGYMKVALNGGSLKDVASYGAFSDYQGPACSGYFPANNSLLAGGGWQVVWGPCVYVAPRTAEDFVLSLYASNSMYVAYSESLKTYVVAIAATNPANLEDWIQEDFDVYAEYTADWSQLTIPFERTKHKPLPESTPQISAATATGISALLGMTDPKQGTLQAFLKSVANSENTLVFTGHSLAGALSPTLAFYLYPNSTPASSQWGSINVFPSAGATPGNQAWLELFTAEGAYPTVTDYVNLHDIVPQAWNNLSVIIQQKDSAGNYPSIFGAMESGLLSIGDTVTTLVQLMSKRTEGIDYANITHNTFGSTDFSTNWGHFSWTEKTDEQGYTSKTYPVWNIWPNFTDANPISASNPLYKYKVIPTVLDQLGNLIQATHIDQYHNALAVTPVPLLPGVPADWRPVNPDLETFLALLKKLIG